MGWLGSSCQAVFDHVSNVISKAQAQPQQHRPSNHDHLNPKTLLQASLLATVSSERRSEGLPASCSNAELSCHNTTVVDTCCLNYPGGRMLQTQFWDTSPPVGPLDSWTVHGLWLVHYNIQLYPLPSNACLGLISATGHMKHIATFRGHIPIFLLYSLLEAEQVCCHTWKSSGRTTKVMIRSCGRMNGRSMELV